MAPSRVERPKFNHQVILMPVFDGSAAIYPIGLSFGTFRLLWARQTLECGSAEGGPHLPSHLLRKRFPHRYKAIVVVYAITCLLLSTYNRVWHREAVIVGAKSFRTL